MTSPSKNSSITLGVQGPAGAPQDPLRAMLTTLIQEPLEREFTQVVAAQFERTSARRAVRNGRRRRRLTTRLGTIELRVPNR